MNAAYLHLALNHVPVLGTLFGLLLLAVAVLRRNDTLLHASCVTFLVVALAVIPVYLAGEGAEEIVEGEPGVSHEAIEAHEEIALLALIAVEVLGLLALVALVLSRSRRLPVWIGTGLLVLALVAVGLMGLTAERGGKINHPEAQAGGNPAERRGSH